MRKRTDASKDIRARHEARSGRKVFCTRDLGAGCAVGYRDADGFHVMKPADYVNAFKEQTGHYPTHRMLLKCQDIPKKARDYIAGLLSAQNQLEAELDKLVASAIIAAENGTLSVDKTKKSEKATKNGKKAAAKNPLDDDDDED